MTKILILLVATSAALFGAALCAESYDQSEADGGQGGGKEDSYGGKLDSIAAATGHESYGLEHGGYGGDESYGHAGGPHGYGHGHDLISAAIISQHSVKHVPVYSSGAQGNPTLIDVEAGVAPIVLNIKSRSSPVIAQHKHYGLEGSFKKTFSSDKPHILKHVVTKPVIHELKEVILPYRRHLQKIKPVRQSIKTLVHHGKHHGHYY